LRRSIATKATGGRLENLAGSMFRIGGGIFLFQIGEVRGTDSTSDGFDVELKVLFQAISQAIVNKCRPDRT
jgi:hypothetical protein